MNLITISRASIISLLYCFFARAESIEVKIDAGTLRGESTGAIHVFRGIPYAAPPVSALRWRPPQPVQPWTGVRDAAAFGAVCPQDEMATLIDHAPSRMSEDCLTLNIWAPAQPQPSAPVMVWIHGGSNVSGAGSRQYYDGSSFAGDGIVLVTINYRLGRLGFFAHPALTAAAGAKEPLANFGLMDQIAALRWVQENIHAFGGDPKNVTVFGESAGGGDILAILTASSARGLFAKAVVESGGGWTRPVSLKEAEANGGKIAGKLGLGASATAEQLRGVSSDSLVKLGFEDELALTVDGRLLTEPPTHAFANGRFIHVPLMIGSNSDEASLLDLFHAKPSEVLSEFKPDEISKARNLYGADTDDTKLARDLFRDANFAAPSRWVARIASASVPVFLYRFSYIRERQRGRVAGASHGSEIPYVFDSWRQAPMGGAFLADQDRAEVQTLHSAWVAFAKTGAAPWQPYRPGNDELFEFGVDSAHARPCQATLLDLMEKHDSLN